MPLLMASSISSNPFSLSISSTQSPKIFRNSRFTPSFASLSSSPSSSPSHNHPPSSSTTTSPANNLPFVEYSKPPPDKKGLNYPNQKTSPVVQFVRATESNIERVIFDFRFLALFAVAGSLAGSLLCFLNGCVYIVDAYKVYWTSCSKGVHSGQMVLRLVEAIGKDHKGSKGLPTKFQCNFIPKARIGTCR